MGGVDWDSFFVQAGQIRSTGEACRLLNTISTSFGIQHFRVAKYHFGLAATVGREAPSPLRAEAASLFDSFLREQAGPLVDRLQTSNKPIWMDCERAKYQPPPNTPTLLCCPIRYGRSAKTTGLFLSREKTLGVAETIFLQGVVVRLLERFLALGAISDPSNQTLNKRERICLDLFSRGYDFAAIAKELGVPEQTIAASMNVAGSRLRAKTRPTPSPLRYDPRSSDRIYYLDHSTRAAPSLSAASFA